METKREMLEAIAVLITNIKYEGLTSTETTIANMLLDEGYLTKKTIVSYEIVTN